MANIENRRPLKVRDANLAKLIARTLSQKNITPNQISVMSIFFAALAGGFLYLTPRVAGIQAWAFPLLAAACIQLRLLCNLFDGMVAVEGGKKTPAGELFNDIPDRIADPIILIAAGYAVAVVSWGGALGWCAALLAVMTAYVRTLGSSVGAPANFQGPMAKQHRMAVVTFACLVCAVEAAFFQQSYAMLFALSIVVVGCMITLYRRVMTIYHYLGAHKNV